MICTTPKIAMDLNLGLEMNESLKLRTGVDLDSLGHILNKEKKR